MTVQSVSRRFDRRPWLAFAGAVGCFLVVSAASTAPEPLLKTVGATALAILGGGLTGVWARRVGRRMHAGAALVLWCLGIVLSGATFVRAGGEATASTGVESVLLWTVALLAGVTTLYLGLREVGAADHPVAGDRVVDGDV